MNETQFKEQFITAFLATWCANNHADLCSRGKQESLYHPPIEDAIDIANEVWKNMQK